MLKMWILIVFLVLIKCAVDDVRTHSINVVILVGGFIAAIVWGLLYKVPIVTKVEGLTNFDVRSIFLPGVLGLVPGIVFLFISKISKGLGEGDAYTVLFIGGLLGVTLTINIITVACLLSLIYSIFLIKKKRVHNKYEYPFVPFILAGFIICIFAQIVIKKPVLL